MAAPENGVKRILGSPVKRGASAKDFTPGKRLFASRPLGRHKKMQTGGLKHAAMKFSKTDFKNSLSGLILRRPAPPSDSVLEEGIEDNREAMLDLLGDEGGKQFAATTRRIRYATDIKDLWYLRGDLMAALAGLHGEVVAREKIAQINAQFQGLLPGGLASRPSPLG
jgi:hypothetical protein